MAAFYGLLSAITYGAADFLGGLVSRRVPVLTVVVVSQAIGFPLVLGLLVVIDGTFSWESMAWGAASGVAGACGVALLYRGLAIGRMSVVAPVTAVEAASVPVVAGLLFGERPSAVSLVGVAIALVAITLVSLAPDPPDDDDSDGNSAEPYRARTLTRPGLIEAIGAGFSFAAFFVLLERAGDASGAWPLLGARIASMAAVLIAAAVTSTKLRPPPGTVRIIGASGLLDVAANVFYLAGTRRGLLSLVAVVTSLYPAATVVLARIVLRERMTGYQVTGLLSAGVGVVLIAGG